jgi:hypothetical protein
MKKTKSNLRFRLVQDRVLIPSDISMVFHTCPHWFKDVGYLRKDPSNTGIIPQELKHWWAVVPMNADSQTYILDHYNT